MNTKQVNKFMAITEEVVREQAPLILKELGLESDNDLILDRITVTSKMGVDIPPGNFNYKMLRKNIVGEPTYIVGTGYIEISPFAMMSYINKKGELKSRSRFARFLLSGPLSEYYRRLATFILAHELRHYWQFYTGEYFKNEMHLGGRPMLPYNMQWGEKDANKFAAKYMKEVYKKK